MKSTAKTIVQVELKDPVVVQEEVVGLRLEQRHVAVQPEQPLSVRACLESGSDPRFAPVTLAFVSFLIRWDFV